MNDLAPVNPALVSDELYDKSIGELNRKPAGYGSRYNICIIHLIDSVSRGYTTPAEAYDALAALYFPENLTTRRSAYQHLL